MVADEVWNRWDRSPELEPGVVDVWRVRLDLDQEAGAEGWPILSADEQDRAERFRFEKHRLRFVRSHAAVREVLAEQLGVGASDIGFRTGERGKPHVAGEAGRVLEFNLAHSGDVALIAVTVGCEVGVDVERHRTIESGVAERFFSANEAAGLRGLSGAQWTEAFFRCWTRKEAFLKASGMGLAFGLDAFSVSLDERAAVLEVAGSEREAGEWSLADVSPGESYSAALAVRFPLREVRCWQFD